MRRKALKGFSDAVASGSLLGIDSFFVYRRRGAERYINTGIANGRDWYKTKSRRNRFGGTLFHFYLNVAT